MASRARRQMGNEDEFVIHLSHLEMLKLERLLRRLSEADGHEIVLVDKEESQWLLNARQLFTPELPSGGYEI